MARRSATNARYQKYTGPEGKTRKSAAAAKPVRSGTGSKSTSSSSSSKSGASAMSVKVKTPEYLAARNIWWWALGVGLVLTAVSWAVRAYVHAPWAAVASSVTLGLAYAAIFYALYIDWTKMRPQRQAALKAARQTKDKR